MIFTYGRYGAENNVLITDLFLDDYVAGEADNGHYIDFFELNANAAPVPEPFTMTLITTALVGLAGWGRRKYKL